MYLRLSVCFHCYSPTLGWLSRKRTQLPPPFVFPNNYFFTFVEYSILLMFKIKYQFQHQIIHTMFQTPLLFYK